MPDEYDDAIDAGVWHRHGGRPAGPAVQPGARVARLVSRLYARANAPLRERMLARLLRPLSPLGLVAIAAGAFAGHLQRRGNDGLRSALDEAVPLSREQVFELAHFVEQVSPDALQQVAQLVADSPVGMAAFSVSAALLLLRLLRRPGVDGVAGRKPAPPERAACR